MIDTQQFGKQLKQLGFGFYTGVPCSFLKNLINYAINDCEYVGAANEGDAVAIASGAFLGGRKPVVLMQNSGLTNAVSPLVSLNHPFRIPLLGFVSLRGEPGVPDEPQHELMGRITTRLLTLMEIEWAYLSTDTEEAGRQLKTVSDTVGQNRPYFFVVRKGTFAPEILREQEPVVRRNLVKRVKTGEETHLPARHEALYAINALKDHRTVQLATTGKTGRELYEIEDHESNFYMVGSMGCVGALGLGLALARSGSDAVVVDGDGSLLMRMGILSTIGSCSPPNLLHILLDNNVHDSTGGQKTVSDMMDFVEIAAACGYPNAIYVHSLLELETCIKEWKKEKGLTFLYLKIAAGSLARLGRPALKPHEVRERLQRCLNSGFWE